MREGKKAKVGKHEQKRQRWRPTFRLPGFLSLTSRILRFTDYALRCTFLLSFVLPTVSGVAGETEIDYYHPTNILKFADALYQEGDYLRAAGEYQRYLFHNPQDTDRILYRIAVSYRLGGHVDRATQFFETVLAEHPQSQFASLARYEIGYSYFLTGQYHRSLQYLNETQHLLHDEKVRWQSQQLIGLNYLMQKKWDDASRVYNQFDLEALPPHLQETIPIYRKYAEDGKHLPSKSPVLAGLLSTIVPGTGKIYVGRANDAFFTVLMLGLTGWQTYDGFHRDGISSTKGWIFGTLSGIFYLGNIYGSAVAAQVHNRQVEAEFLATIQMEFP